MDAKPLSWRMKELVRLLVSGEATIEANLQTLEQWADVDVVALEAQVAAKEEVLNEVYNLADGLVDAGKAKTNSLDTPDEGFLGRRYYQGQKDTARKILAEMSIWWRKAAGGT